MAQLFQVGRPLSRLIQRWRAVSHFGTRAQISEMPSWIQPTVRADRDWDIDERQVWGYTADEGNNSLGTNFPAVAVFAGINEVHVRKIDFKIQRDDGSFIGGMEVNLLTPPETYNPVANGTGQFFPFLQTTPSVGVTAPLSVPQAFVLAGFQTALMGVTIGGVPVFPAIGPRYTNVFGGGPVPLPAIPVMANILDWSDPSLIIPPFRVLALQFFNPPAGGAVARLFVNLYISEREVA